MKGKIIKDNGKYSAQVLGAWLDGCVWCLGCLRKNQKDIREIPEEDLIRASEVFDMVGEKDAHCCDHCAESLLTFPEGTDLSKIFRT